MSFVLAKKLGVEALFSAVQPSKRGTQASPAQATAAASNGAGSNSDAARTRSISLGLPARPGQTLISGPHSLFLSNSNIDFYLLPGSRIVAHFKNSASIALLDAVQGAVTSSSASQVFATSGGKPLVLEAPGDVLEQVVILSNGSIALLSSKITLQLKSNDQKTKNRSPSPKKKPATLARANTEFLPKLSSKADSGGKNKSSSKPPKVKRADDGKKLTSEDKKAIAKEEKAAAKHAKDSEDSKALKKAKKSKDKNKNGDTKKDKESKKDKEGKKDKQTMSAPINIAPAASPSLGCGGSPTVTSSGSPSKLKKQFVPELALPDASFEEIGFSEEGGVSRSPAGGSESVKSVGGRTKVSNLSNSTGIAREDSAQDEEWEELSDEAGSRSGSAPRLRPLRRSTSGKLSSSPTTISSVNGTTTHTSQSIGISKPASKKDGRDSLLSMNRQSSVIELPSSLRRSKGSPASAGLDAHSSSQNILFARQATCGPGLTTKSQWIQVLSVDVAKLSAFPSATLYPDVCAEMGGIKRILPGPDGSLLIESETTPGVASADFSATPAGQLFHLPAESSVPQPLKLPDDISLRVYHLHSLSGGRILFLKNSAAEFILGTVEPPTPALSSSPSAASGLSSSPTPSSSHSGNIVHVSSSPTSSSPPNSGSTLADTTNQKDSSSPPSSPKRKQPKTKSKFGILDHFRRFTSSSVATLQESDAERIGGAHVFHVMLRAQAPESATFLKFEIQNNLLTALTAVCLLTWEINGDTISSSQMNRIPLTHPLFAICVTNDRIVTGDIDGTIAVYERATGRRKYSVNLTSATQQNEDSNSVPPSPSSTGSHIPNFPETPRSFAQMSSSPASMSFSDYMANPNASLSPTSAPSHFAAPSSLGTSNSPLVVSTPLRTRSESNDMRKISLMDRMANRVTHLHVLFDFYVVARFEHGECSVWNLSANQLEPLQKLVKKATHSAASSARCGAIFLSAANGEDGLVCMTHTRNGATKLRLWRCRAPSTNFSTTSAVGSVKAPLAATLIRGEMPDMAHKPSSGYAEEIQKLSLRIYEAYPWLGLLNQEAIAVLEISNPSRPLIYVNAGFEKLTLYASEEVLGTNLRFLHGKYTPEDDIARLKNAIDSGDFNEFQLLSYRKDGVPFFNCVTIMPIKGIKKNTRTTHAVIILRNVSPQRLQPRNAAQWSPGEVAMWLEETNFSTYGLLVLHQQVTGLALLHADEPFLAAIGVVPDDQQPLLRAIQGLKSLSAPTIFNVNDEGHGDSESSAAVYPSLSDPSTNPTASKLGVGGRKSLSSSISMSLDWDNVEGEAEEYGNDDFNRNGTLRKKRTTQLGTLIKLDLNGEVAMVLLKKSSPEVSWEKVQAAISKNFEFDDESKPCNLIIDSPILGKALVTQQNWPTIISNHLYGIMRLHLIPSSPDTPTGSLKLRRRGSSSPATNLILPMTPLPPSLSPSQQSPSPSLQSPTPSNASGNTGASTPSDAVYFGSNAKPASQASLASTESAANSETDWPSAYHHYSDAVYGQGGSVSTPNLTTYYGMARSNSSSHLSETASSNASPRGNYQRYEDSLTHPTSVSRSTSRDFMLSPVAPRRTPSTGVLSLGTSLGSLSSYFGHVEEGEHGLLIPSMSRCVEKIQKYSPEGAKVFSRLFKRSQEQYSWLSAARGATAIIENTPLHQFVFVNSEMEKMTLYTRSQLLGRSYRLLFCKSTSLDDQSRIESLQANSEASSGAPCLDLELVLENASGLPFSLSLMAYPLFATKEAYIANQPTHFLCIHKDITSLKLQELPVSKWTEVELSSWFLGSSDFSSLALECYLSGITGSDMLAACENPKTLDLLARQLGINSVRQRTDFVDWILSNMPHSAPLSGARQAIPRQYSSITSTTGSAGTAASNDGQTSSATSDSVVVSSGAFASALMTPNSTSTAPNIPFSSSSSRLESIESSNSLQENPSPLASPRNASIGHNNSNVNVLGPYNANNGNKNSNYSIQTTQHSGLLSPLPTHTSLNTPASNGSPRALSAPIPTVPASPRNIISFKGGLEQHMRRSEEKTVVKIYFGAETAILSLVGDSTPWTYARIAKFAIETFGTSQNIALHAHSYGPNSPHHHPGHSQTQSNPTINTRASGSHISPSQYQGAAGASGTRTSSQILFGSSETRKLKTNYLKEPLDQAEWARLLADMRGRIIRLDLTEFSVVGLPVEPSIPVLFWDLRTVQTSSHSPAPDRSAHPYK